MLQTQNHKICSYFQIFKPGKESRKIEESKPSTVKIFNILNNAFNDRNTEDIVIPRISNVTDMESQESDKNLNPSPTPFMRADLGRQRGSQINQNPSPRPFIRSDFERRLGATLAYPLGYSLINEKQSYSVPDSK